MFAAADGETNNVTVSIGGGNYTVVDTGASVLNPVAPCVTAGANTVTCASAGITALTIDGRDLDDTISVGAGTVAATINGGGG